MSNTINTTGVGSPVRADRLQTAIQLFGMQPILDDLINASERQPSVKILVGAELVVRSSDKHAKRKKA